MTRTRLHQSRRFALRVAGALLLAPGMSAQSTSAAMQERERPDGLGYHIARLNDVDGDKCADLAIDDGARNAWVISGKTGAVLSREQSLWSRVATLGGDTDDDGAWDILTWGMSREPGLVLRSGKDLHVIRTLKAPTGMKLIWDNTVCAGDWDLDGKPDIAFGGYGDQNETKLVVSGRTGEVLHQVTGAQDRLLCTRMLWQDIDRDGHPDFISATEPSNSNPRSMYVHVQCTGAGSTPLTIPSESDYEGFAAGFAVVPDVDGDGWRDLLVVHAIGGTFDPAGKARFDEAKSTGGIAGRAVVFSSKTGKVLRTLETSYAEEMCEHVTVANLSDIDGDGIPEFAISYDRYFAFGRVVVYSGASGRVIREHAGVEGTGPTATLSEFGRFAVCVVALGDTDGDGVDDYAIGASGGVDGMGAGCVSVYSGKTGALLRGLWKRDLVKK